MRKTIPPSTILRHLVQKNPKRNRVRAISLSFSSLVPGAGVSPAQGGVEPTAGSTFNQVSSISPLQKRAHPLRQRLQVSVIHQRTSHPHRIAKEKALVQNLTPTERAAGHLPRQPIQCDALLRRRIRRREVPL